MARHPNTDKVAGLKRMGKPKKEVTAKVLRNEGMTYREIGEWLGLSDDTARRYAMIPKTPDELQEFETEVAGIIRGMQYEGLSKANDRLLELIPKERKISEVVKAAEYFQGGAKSGAPNIQVNILNKLDEQRGKYNLDE